MGLSQRTSYKLSDVHSSKQRLGNAPKRPQKRSRTHGTLSATSSPGEISFEQLPTETRQRVYCFLGFPAKSTFIVGTDSLPRYSTSIALRELYKIDLTKEGTLSTPWNYEMNKRNKRATPRVVINMMCTNHKICDELYDILYSQSLFLVHPPSIRRPAMPIMGTRALKYITHIMISFDATETTKAHFNVDSHHEALKQTIKVVGSQVPNVQYFAVNLWSFQLEPKLAIDFYPSGHNSTEKGRNDQFKSEKPDFRDTSFLNGTLLELMSAHLALHTFALLRNMQPRGQLNWGGGNKDTVRKGLSRNLRKCMEKVYLDDVSGASEDHGL